MATPVGHALAGLVVASLAHRVDGAHAEAPSTVKSTGAQLRQYLDVRGPIVVLALFMALAPDLDLIAGMLQGRPILYHGGVSHSLGSGILLSLLVAWLWPSATRQWRDSRPGLKRTARTIFIISLLAFATHLLLDMLGPDGREPYGIPLLWPLSNVRFLSPTPILLGVHHTSNTTAGFAEFLSGVFSLHNIIAIAWECLLTIPFILWGEWRHRSNSKSLRAEPAIKA